MSRPLMIAAESSSTAVHPAAAARMAAAPSSHIAKGLVVRKLESNFAFISYLGAT